MTQQIIEVNAIGRVIGGRFKAIDDDWGDVRAAVELDPGQFHAGALMGLEAFSHAEIVFHFDRVPPEEVIADVRHPRGRTDWPQVGIFAQRAKSRPNRIGVSVCRIIGVHGLRIEVEGLDAVDGTPVLDIKPVMSGFLPRGPVVEPSWAVDIMSDYWTK